MTAPHHESLVRNTALATVRVCAALSLLLLLGTQLLSFCSETEILIPQRDFELYLGGVKQPLVTGGALTAAALEILVFWFPYCYMLFGTDRRLAWSSVTGVFVLLVSVYAIAFPEYPPVVAFTAWPEMPSPARVMIWKGVAAVQVVLLGVSVLALRRSREIKSEGFKVPFWPPIAYFLFLLLLSMIPTLDANPAARWEAPAVGRVRTILLCAEAHRSRNPGQAYPESLAEMAADECIDSDMASGRRFRYQFIYSPKRAENSSVQDFAVLAIPVGPRCPQLRSFYSDSSGRITSTWEQRAATKADPELD